MECIRGSAKQPHFQDSAHTLVDKVYLHIVKCIWSSPQDGNEYILNSEMHFNKVCALVRVPHANQHLT